MQYQIWSNMSDRRDKFIDGYQDGDRMLRSYGGLVKSEECDTTNSLSVLESLFFMFNRDDRPNGQIAHSLSVSDVVVLEGIAYAVEPMGFTEIPDWKWD